MRVFLAYAVIEMAVLVALVATIGFGWTMLLVIGAFVLGLALAGAQLRRQIAALQRGMRDPAAGVTDSVLVALGSILMIVPGLLTSLAGVLMLLPPTRALMRPAAGAFAARALDRRMVFVDLPGQRRAGTGNYIDGEVVDVQDEATVVDVPALRRPD